MGSEQEIIWNNLQDVFRLWPLLGVLVLTWILYAFWRVRQEMRKRK